MTEYISPAELSRIRDRRKRAAEAPEPEARECPVCGAVFETTNKRKIYCHLVCNEKAHRLRSKRRFK